jgi:hypothetical protein
MEIAYAEERDFPDHAPEYQRMVCDQRGTDRMDWTAALALARSINNAPVAGRPW